LDHKIKGTNTKLTRLHLERGNLTTFMQQQKNQLQFLSSDQLIKVADRHVDNPYHFFNPVQEETLEIEFTLAFDEIRSVLGDRNCKWIGKLTVAADKKKASRKIRSKFIGGVAGNLCGYVKSKRLKTGEIDDLSKKIRTETDNLAVIEQEIASMTQDQKALSSQELSFIDQAQNIGLVSGSLKAESMSLEDYRKTSVLFQVDLKNPIGIDLQEIVKKYCEALAICVWE